MLVSVRQQRTTKQLWYSYRKILMLLTSNHKIKSSQPNEAVCVWLITGGILILMGKKFWCNQQPCVTSWSSYRFRMSCEKPCCLNRLKLITLTVLVLIVVSWQWSLFATVSVRGLCSSSCFPLYENWHACTDLLSAIADRPEWTKTTTKLKLETCCLVKQTEPQRFLYTGKASTY